MDWPVRRAPARRWGLTRRSLTPQQLVVTVLVTLGLVCAAGVTVVWLLNARPNTLAYELAKALMQLLGVVVVGAAVSLATFNYQRHRDHHREVQQRSDELLRALLKEALEGYQQVKRARRLLRARLWVIGSLDSDRLATYDEQLAAINDAQLDFERIKLSARGLRDPRINPKQLEVCAEKIEKELGSLIRGYERTRGEISDTKPATFELPSELKKFINPADSRPFRESIAEPFAELHGHLQAALLVSLE